MAWRIASSFPRNTRLTQRAWLMAAIALGLSTITWNAYQDWQLLTAEDTSSRPTDVARSSNSPVSITPLLAAHLFGQPSKANNTPLAEVVNAPETRLRLKLRGVFAHSDNDQSRALVAEQDKSAQYYRLGDSLPGGATLDRVATDHVVLNRNGVLETLSFNADKKRARTATIRRQAPMNYASQPTQKDALASQQNTESIRERLKRLREAREL